MHQTAIDSTAVTSFVVFTTMDGMSGNSFTNGIRATFLRCGALSLRCSWNQAFCWCFAGASATSASTKATFCVLVPVSFGQGLLLAYGIWMHHRDLCADVFLLLQGVFQLEMGDDRVLRPCAFPQPRSRRRFPRLSFCVLLVLAGPSPSGLGICFSVLGLQLSFGRWFFLLLGILLVAIRIRGPTTLFRSFEESWLSFWFFLRSRHQTLQGVQQPCLLTFFQSSQFLSSLHGVLLEQVTRGRLLLVRRLGFPRLICSQAFHNASSPLKQFRVSPFSVIRCRRLPRSTSHLVHRFPSGTKVVSV